MFDHILSVLFPERCRGCNKNGTALCDICLSKIRPASIILDNIPSLAFFDYGDPMVQKAIWELKYHRKSPTAKILVQEGAEELQDFVSGAVQGTTPLNIVFVPVPQHYTKTFTRGFNQSALIAKWLQSLFPLASVSMVLAKNRATVAQARARNRKERQENLAHSMSAKTKLDKKTLYIIVDDVITTGSTVHEAGRALRAAGARYICAVALAHGR